MELKLIGFKEVDAVLKGLPKQVNHKLFSQAHAQAAKVLVQKAKNLAPEGPNGNLVDSIGTVKMNFSKASELGLTQTGPRRGRYNGNVGHLVEYGTRARVNRHGASRGVMPKKPFMEPAWEQTKSQVIKSVNGFVGKALFNFMKRTIKNG